MCRGPEPHATAGLERGFRQLHGVPPRTLAIGRNESYVSRLDEVATFLNVDESHTDGEDGLSFEYVIVPFDQLKECLPRDLRHLACSRTVPCVASIFQQYGIPSA